MTTPHPTAPAITGLTARPLTRELVRPWGDTVREMHVVEVIVTAADGTSGTGFSWTPTIGATAIIALLENDIRDFVLGRPAEASTLWPDLWAHLHEAGSGGLTTIAMAGVDLALWDRAATLADRPLADALGRRRESAPVYGSGVNLHYPLDELVAQAQRWVRSGYTGAKIKVGRPDLAEDVDRVAAVREVLGPDRRLMVDANQRWDLPTARRAAAALSPFGIDWLEEPLRADDTWGYANLRASIDIPVALGENCHTVHRFRDLIAASAVDVVQPNVVRVGGITPYLAIADLARTHSLTVAPHLLPELSGHLALAAPVETWVEDVEDASFERLGFLAEPTGVTLAGGRLRVGDRPGLGFRFHPDSIPRTVHSSAHERAIS
ncbi:racemase [Frondihabitans sucicola]|uniref:Racemase n=1 Tax=Frondihabitans sucicola TaxID=1268041 RepID=A0ABM8GUZ8_9MICO|nr:mandelate racemase/muconate lactonizing enzyme family protein [Frondihabitans sucicola]BDZ52281.1 racemase [Frondihabitans sucicola]